MSFGDIEASINGLRGFFLPPSSDVVQVGARLVQRVFTLVLLCLGVLAGQWKDAHLRGPAIRLTVRVTPLVVSFRMIPLSHVGRSFLRHL